MRHWKRHALKAACLIPTSAALVIGASPAGASPSGPNSTTGTFSCESGLTGTFIAPGTSEHSDATTWSVAHLTFDGGGKGIFVPASFDFTFSVNGVPVGTEVATKGHTAGPESCTIFSSFTIPGPQGGTATLSGTVTGKIVKTG